MCALGMLEASGHVSTGLINWTDTEPQVLEREKVHLHLQDWGQEVSLLHNPGLEGFFCALIQVQ